MPPWLKEKWIEWLGPERIYELYGGTEAPGRHDHIGRRMARTHAARSARSARPRGCASSAKTATRSPPAKPAKSISCPMTAPARTYHYLGAEPKRRADGWESLGDIGRLDAEGYLYLGDRLADMILRGGANIYPAEVEAAVIGASRGALLRRRRPARSGIRTARARHPRTRPALPDAQAVADGMAAFLADRLSRYKHPESFETVQRRPARRFRQGSPHRCCATNARLAERQPRFPDHAGPGAGKSGLKAMADSRRPRGFTPHIQR